MNDLPNTAYGSTVPLPHPWNGSQAGAAAPATPIMRLNDSLGQLSDVCANVERLADDLCGAVPQAVNKGEQGSLSGGVFGQINMGADAVNTFSARIHAAIGRIRSQLP